MFRLPILLSAAAALVAPAAASAAPLGELPFLALTRQASCLQATGAPGELARAGTNGLEFLQAGPGGLVPTGHVVTGGQPIGCPAVAAQPGGAAALIVPAIISGEEAEGQVWVAARDPGGNWTQASLAAASASAYPIGVAAAASARGDAIAVWIDVVEKDEVYRFRIRAVRRGPGEPFGAPVEIATGPLRNLGVVQGVRAGIAAGGETVVAWASDSAVQAAVAPPGATFAPPQRLGSLPKLPPFEPESPTASFEALAAPPPALAVAPDGRALVFFASRTGPKVAERAPGGVFAVAALAGVADASDQIAADLAADGRAIVAWRVAGGGAVRSAARERPGPFGPATTIAPPISVSERWLLEPSVILAAGETLIGPLFDGTHNLSARLTAGGRALLTWIAPRTRAGSAWQAPSAATLPLAGGTVERQTLGGPLRHAGFVTPVLVGAGAPAVAWSDNGGARHRGRLHLAIEGAVTAADPAAPRVRVVGPKVRVLHATDALELRVTCSAACDVRGRVLGMPGVEASTSLTGPGTTTLRISPAEKPLAPARPGPVRVRVLSGAPGARNPRSATLSVQLRRAPIPPLPKILHLEAHRRGPSVVVTWRSDATIETARFVVVGRSRRGGPAAPLSTDAIGFGGSPGLEGFRTTIRAAAAVRWVTVYAASEYGPEEPGTTVRVSQR